MKKDLTFINSEEKDYRGMFCSITLFPKDRYDVIETITDYLIFENTECVIKEGHICRDMFFILEGLGAGYTITPQGKKRYVYLQDESCIIASIPTIVSGKPSRVNCEILPGSICAKIGFDELNRIAQEDKEIASWYIKLIFRGLLRASERVEQFILSDAKERLLGFLEGNPSLAARVQKQQLAGYLGIEPESLSRILGAKM